MTNYILSDGIFSINGQDFLIENIEFEEILGKGANAVVLKGFDKFLQRNIAIKFWLPRKGYEYPNKDQFLAEIRKFSPLNRPQIVQIYDANIINDKYCYAILEFINGITLRKWLSNERDLTTRLDIAKNLFTEIIYLHKLGIFHGDLHDKNIMIKDKGELKILDFGTSIFSKLSNPHDREKEVLIETGLKLLSEEKKYQFLDQKALKESSSECTPYAFYTLTRILGFFTEFLKTAKKIDDEKILIFACYIWVVYIPFFNIMNFVDAFEKLNINSGMICYFFSLIFKSCNEKINNIKSEGVTPIKITHENIESLLEMYFLLRKKSILDLKTGEIYL